MARPKKSKDTLGLLHSDKLVENILNTSNKYIEDNSEVKSKVDEYNWIFRSLFDLLPETIENFWSGHVFPIAEAEYELECSIVLCKLGFYKHAIVSLRNVLELGLLSVYWDIDNQSHIDIQNWFKSIESTPFRRQVFNRLAKNSNIKTFDDKHDIFKKTSELYTKLSNFSHTRVFGYSSRKLNKHHSNVNSFNEVALNKWLELTREVTEIVTIFHILKYPVALQNTPIWDKLGINIPAGGFLQPSQTERIKKLISGLTLKDLQKISDNDPDATAMAKWVNDQPDLTEEEFLSQIETSDKNDIKREGYNHWIKQQRKLYNFIKTRNPDEYSQKLEYFQKLKLWAKENNCLRNEEFERVFKRVTTSE